MAGRVKCDVCHRFFGDSGLVKAVRKKLDSEGIVELYKKYVNTVGIS
jgi:hypothetical protein